MKKFFALLLVAMMLISSGIFSIADEVTEEEIPAVVEIEEVTEAEEPAEQSAEEEPKAEPAKEEPKAEPAKEEPKAEEPAKEEPKAEPVKEEPKAEEPVKEEPKAEEPAEEDPMAVVEAPAEFTGTIRISVNFEGDTLYYGDTVTLRATVRNANLSYTIRWEANAGNGWYKVGTGNSYRFTVTEANASLAYRAVLVVD